MTEVKGRRWPNGVPFTPVNSADGKPYIRNGFECSSKPGDFKFEDSQNGEIDDPKLARVMEYVCPRTGKYCGTIRVAYPDKPANGPSWTFDGNFDAPSLTPSINCVSGCGWHGYLTAGIWKD